MAVGVSKRSPSRRRDFRREDLITRRSGFTRPPDVSQPRRGFRRPSGGTRRLLQPESRRSATARRIEESQHAEMRSMRRRRHDARHRVDQAQLPGSEQQQNPRDSDGSGSVDTFEGVLDRRERVDGVVGGSGAASGVERDPRGSVDDGVTSAGAAIEMESLQDATPDVEEGEERGW